MPANEFVASFVGEPPMSFLDAELVRDPAPHLVIKGTEEQPVRMDLSESAAQFLRQQPAPQLLRVGVRATDLSISTAASDTHTVPAEVYVVETLGHRDIVTAKVGPHLVKVAAVSGIGLRVRDSVWLNINPRTYHLFGDEEAIAHPLRDTYVPEGV